MKTKQELAGQAMALNSVASNFPKDPWYLPLVRWWLRRFCKHRSIVSVIDTNEYTGRLHHFYDYCERCGKTWHRYGGDVRG